MQTSLAKYATTTAVLLTHVCVKPHVYAGPASRLSWHVVSCSVEAAKAALCSLNLLRPYSTDAASNPLRVVDAETSQVSIFTSINPPPGAGCASASVCYLNFQAKMQYSAELQGSSCQTLVQRTAT
jgi:hypothetical protein